jgi:hypothetical protein
MALVLSGVLACAAWAWRKLEHQRGELRHALATRHAAPATPPLVRVAPAYDASAREMLAERRFPWVRALTAVEAVAMIGVTPTGVEFAVADQAVRLEVNFENHAKLLDYLNQLNAEEPQLRWALTQAQADGGRGGSATLVGGMK